MHSAVIGQSFIEIELPSITALEHGTKLRFPATTKIREVKDVCAKRLSSQVHLTIKAVYYYLTKIGKGELPIADDRDLLSVFATEARDGQVLRLRMLAKS